MFSFLFFFQLAMHCLLLFFSKNKKWMTSHSSFKKKTEKNDVLGAHA